MSPELTAVLGLMNTGTADRAALEEAIDAALEVATPSQLIGGFVGALTMLPIGDALARLLIIDIVRFWEVASAGGRLTSDPTKESS